VSTLPEIKTILYATDLGRYMRPVFRHAISLAQHLGLLGSTTRHVTRDQSSAGAGGA
jgi:hypothetical protein